MRSIRIKCKVVRRMLTSAARKFGGRVNWRVLYVHVIACYKYFQSRSVLKHSRLYLEEGIREATQPSVRNTLGQFLDTI